MTEAVKTRIIAHMNKVHYHETRPRSAFLTEILNVAQDHTDSLTQYLQYYCCVPLSSIHKPQMTELTTDGMTLIKDADDEEDYFVPFVPVLSPALDGIRPRVIEMAQRAKLGIEMGKTVEDES